MHSRVGLRLGGQVPYAKHKVIDVRKARVGEWERK